MVDSTNHNDMLLAKNLISWKCLKTLVLLSHKKISILVRKAETNLCAD